METIDALSEGGRRKAEGGSRKSEDVSIIISTISNLHICNLHICNL